jgi:hypothetical protein
MSIEHLNFTFGGTPIIGSQAMEKEQIVPKKKHIKKPWMRLRYHRRIQKKWVKRFGEESVAPVVAFGGRLFTHPDNIERIKEQIAKAQD